MSWADESPWDPAPRIEDGLTDDDYERGLMERDATLSADLAGIDEAQLRCGTSSSTLAAEEYERFVARVIESESAPGSP